MLDENGHPTWRWAPDTAPPAEPPAGRAHIAPPSVPAPGRRHRPTFWRWVVLEVAIVVGAFWASEVAGAVAVAVMINLTTALALRQRTPPPAELPPDLRRADSSSAGGDHRDRSWAHIIGMPGGGGGF